ncbi:MULTISPECIES: DEAD/DEAH box helicase [unclassified Sporolactobacillus]|uniref:DEAD/DEAH box helicase n=1 Tax=unclassified Sporolactobacillus TaxID=2628533 RepID=UPI002367E557|nr:DEAD/DEAH box helicase [Sporolactobacillus sp. CQH2019]MDD9148772.1 DEAD/DEAH box helicase [Sporolactobacillus sp. CQH2019]
MKVRQSMADLLAMLKKDPNIVHWHTIPGRKAMMAPFPENLDGRLKRALVARGIGSLYVHQAEAFETVLAGKDLVLVTPTASGKTLCYNLPVLQTVLSDPSSRALYLFPTKALAQDQKNEMGELIDAIGVPLKSYTYDGDTSGEIRQKIRQAGQIVMTNPDMLHSSILPHHTKWVSLFENLKYIVIDELHTYRGVFGSHVANVLRRLARICSYYGSRPQFICTSATIANPKEHAEALTGRKMALIDRNGAPSVRKHFLFYNPPVVNKQLNVREDDMLAVKDLAARFIKNGIQTIVFARSRLKVELLVSHLQKMNSGREARAKICAYRGGYLPLERRKIEKGLRDGEIMGVVSTNALELGVDIGRLQVCIMTGYPGNMASVWQQAGRTGRRSEDAVIIMVASSNPLDQYMTGNPDYFFSRKPEEARINPDNLMILVDHVKCSAYELPFKKGDTFGGQQADELCEFLSDEDVLHYQAGKWYWMSDAFPANEISLRSAVQDSFAIVDITDRGHVKVIGEMDRFGAMTMLYEDAIYIHQGRQYHVDELDLKERKAYIRRVDVNYYTDSDLAVQLDVLETDERGFLPSADAEKGYGDVSVRALPTVFKKIRFETLENIGWGRIHLPELEMHTNAAWISFPSDWVDRFGKDIFQGALVGLSHLLRHAAPLYVMCDQADLSVVPKIKAPHTERPTVFIYDKYPGGIGLSRKLYEAMPELLEKAKEMAERCGCESGCPSCIGFVNEGKAAKQALIRLLKDRSMCR